MNVKLTYTGALLAAIMVLLGGCGEANDAPDQSAASQAAAVPATAATTQITSDAIEAAAQQIDEAGLMRHINILASDEYEGRAPSTPGGRKTVEYLETQFKQIGLKPAFSNADGASYRQAVELMEITVTNKPPLRFDFAEGEPLTLPYQDQSIVFTSRAGDSTAVQNSELVFVGYGVVAPEYGWNDYEGIDMADKTAVILVNDPGFRNPEDELFKGRTMTYYGRWTYKYEEAARQGAAAAIIVHEDEAAGYPWEVVSGSWSGAQYTLFTEDGNAGNLAVESWITKPAAEQLFERVGMNYNEAVAAAGNASFKPTPMAAKASSELQLSSRESTSYNVAGLLPGSERPDELFIYTAHWDHIGNKPDADKEDTIYNGAQDNATGTAALIEVAEAFLALPSAPQRSVMFLAVTAEESGLLGSQYYGENPPIPMAKHVAGINIDGMSTYGATDDIVVVGYGNSEMDDYLRRVSTEQGRVLVPEPTPEKGYFYRSDHFNLAKKGVPMLYAEAGEQVRGKPAGYGAEKSKEYLQDRYHKPADEVHEGWDNGGILQDLNAHFRIGVAISNSEAWPQWSEGNEFKAIREASLAASPAGN
ncbi:MAG: M28 family peptidase [Gammaproteobacteria bacterium]|nr:M28 family peptidase [Gammaproteobacteria bacterium]